MMRNPWRGSLALALLAVLAASLPAMSGEEGAPDVTILPMPKPPPENKPGPGTPPGSGGQGDEEHQSPPSPGNPGPAVPPPAAPPPSTRPDQDEPRLPSQPKPGDGSAFRRVADGYRNQGDPEGADRVLDRYLGANPRETWALLLRGEARMDMKDYAGARALAQEALALDPSNQRARDLSGMAGAYLRGGIKLDRPLRSPGFKQAEDTGPPEGKAAPSLDTAQFQRVAVISGRPPSASSPSQLLVEHALHKARVNDLPGALLDLTRAIDASPRNQNAWALRAYLDNRLGNHEAAKRDADEALKLDSENPAALRDRAYAQYKLGNLQLALADADKAAALEPHNGLGQLYRAMILERLGRIAEAIQAYEAAARLDPALRVLAEEALRRLDRTSRAPAAPREPGGGRGRWTSLGLPGLAGLALLLFGLRGALRRAAATTTSGPAAPEPAGLARSPALVPGAVLGGNYLITRVLGRGGMGIVYAAEDRVLQRAVAVKQLSTPDRSPEYLDRFLREARLVAKLKHPNLVQIHSVIEDGGEQYLVFEYVEGRTLDEVLAERLRLPAQEARAVLRDLCAALEYAHGERVIHRDVKPGNVMVAPDGSCKVMDFGIAHQARTVSKMTQTAAWGTPPYMAPEQEMGSVAPESDLYALAVIAYEMLAGRRPFEGANCLADKLKRNYAPATALNAELPESLDAFLARALSPEPGERPRSARQFFQEFEAALASPAE